MKWVAVGTIIAIFLFGQAVHIAAAIYDPSTGEKLPDEESWKGILLAVVSWFPLM